MEGQKTSGKLVALGPKHLSQNLTFFFCEEGIKMAHRALMGLEIMYFTHLSHTPSTKQVLDKWQILW
jgi:hypothetical protein